MERSKVKLLIKNRNLTYFKPEIVAQSSEADLAAILKSVAYFRNFPIFKALYTLLYKNKNLSVDQYKSLYYQILEYKKSHHADYILDGFNVALAKSNLPKQTKASYAIMIYNHLYSDNLFSNYIGSRILTKAVKNYYLKNRLINVAAIRKSKVYKINNDNLVKTIRKWNL